jgi:hypothetical protein
MAQTSSLRLVVRPDLMNTAVQAAANTADMADTAGKHSMDMRNMEASQSGNPVSAQTRRPISTISWIKH